MRFGLLSMFCLALLVARTGLTADYDAQALVRDSNVAAFGEWDGLSFRCKLTPVSDLATQLCANVASEFRFRAREAKVPLVVIEPMVGEDAVDAIKRRQRAEDRAGIRHPLTVEFTVFSNSETSSPMGIYASLRATNFYFDAVSADAMRLSKRELSTDNDRDPNHYARPGTLVLWRREAIRATTGHAHANSGVLSDLTGNATEWVVDFFAKYIDFNNVSPEIRGEARKALGRLRWGR